jgi:hypothetical protein
LNNQIEPDRVTREWDKFEAEQAAKTATSQMRAEALLFLWCCAKALDNRWPCCRPSDPMIMRGKLKISRWFALALQTK